MRAIVNKNQRFQRDTHLWKLKHSFWLIVDSIEPFVWASGKKTCMKPLGPYVCTCLIWTALQPWYTPKQLCIPWWKQQQEIAPHHTTKTIQEWLTEGYRELKVLTWPSNSRWCSGEHFEFGYSLHAGVSFPHVLFSTIKTYTLDYLSSQCPWPRPWHRSPSPSEWVKCRVTVSQWMIWICLNVIK